MILNEIIPGTGNRMLRVLGFGLLAFGLFSCNKTAKINANKAFLSLTHVAYGVGPLGLTLEGTAIFPTPVAFGETSGFPGNPYDTVISRVNEMVISQDSLVLLQGNTSFQQGAHYSVYVFDSLDIHSASLIILQDNPSFRTDTFTSIRFMNFSPGIIPRGLKLINTRNDIPYYADTIVIGLRNFVGYNANPDAYTFQQNRIGTYQVFAYTDSSQPAIDSSNFTNMGSLEIDSTINYNIYLQGFPDSSSGANRFQLKSVRLN